MLVTSRRRHCALLCAVGAAAAVRVFFTALKVQDTSSQSDDPDTVQHRNNSTKVHEMSNKVKKILLLETARQLCPKDAEEIIATYLRHRAEGLSVDEIARTVFKVDLPNVLPGNRHSYPFLSRRTLIAFADVVIISKSMRPWPPDRKFLDGDVIFLKGDHTAQFAEILLPRMSTRFVLITHFSDRSVPIAAPRHRHFDILNSSLLIHWFAKNVIREHPKLTLLPLGFGVNNVEENTPVIEDLLRHAAPTYSADGRGGDRSRPDLVYSQFTVRNNPRERRAARTMFAGVASPSTAWLSKQDYWRRLAGTKFVVSPPGEGVDCLRTYEAVLLGAVPVLKNSTLFPVHSQIPALVLENWWKPPVDAGQLERMLLGFRPSEGTGKRVLMAQYWFDKIDAARKRALQSAP